MANLEKKSQMSAIQLTILIVAAQFDVVAIGFGDLLRTAGHMAWLCILVGGVFFYLSAYFAICLAQQFPGETIADYAPRVWGKTLGGLVLFLCLFVFMLHTWGSLQSTARQIAFYMFDRTPYEILLATFIAASAYCALQDLGTLLRVVQMMLFIGILIMLIILLLSGVNFQVVNLWPLFEGGFSQLSSGLVETWTVFTGYQIILMLMPFVRRSEQNIKKIVGFGFAFTTFIILWIIVFVIAGLGVKTAQSVPYPLVSLIRNVEIPGTFLERLDTYLITIKVMIFFTSLSVLQYVTANLVMKYFGHSDHRPWVLAFAPVFFIGSDALHVMRLYQAVHNLSNWLGLSLAFVVIPMTLYLAKRRQKSDANCGAARNR